MTTATEPSQDNQDRHGVLKSSVDSLSIAINKGMEEQVAPYGLVLVEFLLLKFCTTTDECTATQLAEVLPVDASRISRLVNNMVEMGLLRRRRLRSDRRVVMLSLTDRGRALVQQVLEREEIFNTQLTEGVSEKEIDAFVAIAQKALGNCRTMLQSQDA